jgi:hypothetical protein
MLDGDLMDDLGPQIRQLPPPVYLDKKRFKLE